MDGLALINHKTNQIYFANQNDKSSKKQSVPRVSSQISQYGMGPTTFPLFGHVAFFSDGHFELCGWSDQYSDHRHVHLHIW
jgi:hypothetical protein